jgi:hypothetical protein
VSLVKWLDTLSDIGITRIASYYGAAQTNLGSITSKLTGTGFNYWDLSNSAGTNAWCLYQFANATPSFYMLIQWCPGEFFSIPWGTTGAPAAVYTTAATYGGIGVQFAFRTDDVSPWNGTTNNNGADTKGTPVWSSGVTNNLYVFPRCNSLKGDYATKREFLSCFYNRQNLWGTGKLASRLCAVVDASNIAFVTDNSGNTSDGAGKQDVTFFGKFTPINDLNYPSGSAYWMFSTNSDPDPILSTLGSTYTWGSTTPTYARDGGVQHPSHLSGTIGYCIDCLNPSQAYTFGLLANPSPFAYSLSSSYVSKFDESIFVINMNEPGVSGTLGMLGYSGMNDFFRCVYGVQAYCTFNNRTRICWGTSTLNSLHATTPWVTGALPPCRGYSREGIMY